MVERVVENNKKYLRCDELREGFAAERYAYLLRVVRRRDQNGFPYLNFYLKTSDHSTLVGHRFRIDESESLGLDILTLNRTMVKLRFVTQVYNGSFSLIIKEITMVPTADASAFFDSYSEVSEKFEKLTEKAKQVGAPPLNQAIKTASLFSVRCGVVGAFVELIDMVYTIVCARKTEHTEKIINCLLTLVNPYFIYITMMEKVESLPKREVLSLLQSIPVGGDESLSSVTMDAFSALMEQGRPEHLYAHIIYNAFQTAVEQLKLEEAVKSSPKNLTIKHGLGNLIYY